MCSGDPQVSCIAELICRRQRTEIGVFAPRGLANDNRFNATVCGEIEKNERLKVSLK